MVLFEHFVEHVECVGEIPALSTNCDDGVDKEVLLCGRSAELETYGLLI